MNSSEITFDINCSSRLAQQQPEYKKFSFFLFKFRPYNDLNYEPNSDPFLILLFCGVCVVLRFSAMEACVEAYFAKTADTRIMNNNVRERGK